MTIRTIKRRTKIIATIGPASANPDVLSSMILAGTDLIRINFSHMSPDQATETAKIVRQVAEQVNKEVGILADLQGPKIRIARFSQGEARLVEGAQFVLDADLDKEAGNEQAVGIDYANLPRDVTAGDQLLLDDGRLVLKVTAVEGAKIICSVEVGGLLLNNKGINRLGGGLSAEALTEKDKAHIEAAVAMGADYLAVSFPRSDRDIVEARELVEAAGGNTRIIAKIERTEAIREIDHIIRVSDAVMVARGDLGVEIGDAELPGVQKHIIRRARELNKAVITATQMMESMCENTIPTRAEVFDVGNAVLDGSDAVMLSAETATGKHPVKVVEAMSRICLGAERQRIATRSRHRVETRFNEVDEAIAMAAMYTANHLNIRAIVTLTESGTTPLLMSRIRSGIPIYALSRSTETLRLMSLYRGVYALPFDATQFDPTKVNQQAAAVLQAQDIVEPGDFVIITKGDVMGLHGGTNTMKIIKIGTVA